MFHKKNYGLRKENISQRGKCTINICYLILILITLIYVTILIVYFLNLTKNTGQVETYNNKNWNDIVSGCYYINLNESIDRKLYMEDMFNKLNINCKRFEAIKGSDYLHLCSNLNISSGALGCKLSHLELLKKVKKDGWTIIFEDDVKLDINSKNKIVKILNSLPTSSELVLFGTSPRAIFLNIFSFNFKKYNDFIWQTDKNLSCAHAYAITYEGAQKWIHTIEKYLCEKSFDMHEKNIRPIYFAHSFSSNFSDIFRMFIKDFSFAPQNKAQFGYFNSNITNFKFF